MGCSSSVGCGLRLCGIVCTGPICICRNEPLTHLEVAGLRTWLTPIGDLLPIEIDLPVKAGRISWLGMRGEENWHKTIVPDP